MTKFIKFIKHILKMMFVFVFAAVLFCSIINFYVVLSTKGLIISQDEAAKINPDCILVLGAAVRSDGSPSPMLKDRITTGIELYEKNVSDKVLMSGDHTTIYYDEVNIMKNYAVDEGVPSENIFMDHAGISTYDSVYRAKDIFEVKKVVIVTQKYHLYRALYIAKKLGVEAYGVSADERTYIGQEIRDAREIAARVKDFVKVIFKPNPKILGEIISIAGNGDITNDK